MSKQYDVIIIGSGPAGLSAAIYAARARLNMLVLEKNYMSGGQVLNTYEVDNYAGLPGMNGFDMAMKFREHAEKLGAVFSEAEVQDIVLEGPEKKVLTSQGELDAKALILATGAKHRLLGVEGEERLTGQGVSYCATCDGAFFKNKHAIVVGGGDVAAEDAVFLSRICKKVTLIHRRDELRAAKVLQEAVFGTENIEVLWNSVVTAIHGEEKVESATVKQVVTGQEQALSVDGVFVAVGILPNSSLLEGKVEMDKGGYIVAGEDGATSVPGVFAAGDVRTKALRQIVTAVSDGANAVNSVQEYLLHIQ